MEDELALAGTVVTYLDRAKLATREVRTGPEAVAEVRDWVRDRWCWTWDCPGGDGLHVCQRMRVISDCYIIMLTARTNEEDTH